MNSRKVRGFYCKHLGDRVSVTGISAYHTAKSPQELWDILLRLGRIEEPTVEDVAEFQAEQRRQARRAKLKAAHEASLREAATAKALEEIASEDFDLTTLDL